MGSLYLSSIMKVQTTVFVLVATFLCASLISAKSVPLNDVEIEKSQADAVLKRNPRSWWEREEKDTQDESDEDTTDRNDTTNGDDDYETDTQGPSNPGANRKNKKVDWLQLVYGILKMVRDSGAIG